MSRYRHARFRFRLRIFWTWIWCSVVLRLWPPRHPCHCRCGYTCGGPGRCDMDTWDCIEAHFVRDCGHKWGGWREHTLASGASWGSQVCLRCGMGADVHDDTVGP